MVGPLLLLLLVAACAAELGFQPKRQYTYLYEAKQASGIPGLQSQWSAFGLKTKVTIQVPQNDGYLYFKLDLLQQGELKNVYTHQPWRKNYSIPYSPVQQHQDVLSKVFKVQLIDGVISKIITSAEEPIWVVNIKKAIAQIFQLDLQKHQAIDVPSMTQPRNYQSGQQDEFFRVMEDSIGGECETLYETTPHLPQNIKADMLQELTILSQSSLPGIKVPQFDRFQPFIVTKTKNYQNCRSRPNWQHITPGAMSCRSDDCYLTASNRSASARYVLDGDRASFQIQFVVAESEELMYPYRRETEQLWTVTNQTLFLKQAGPMASFFGEPQSPKTYRKLAFQYPTADGEELRMPDLKSAPQMSTHIPGAPVKLIHEQQNMTQVVSIVIDIISKIDRSLHHVPDPIKEDVAGYIIELERALSWLSYDQMSQVYSRLTTQEQRNIFWDTLAVAGTNPAMTQIVDAIHTNKIEKTRLATILATLPINIKTPTYQLVRELFNVYKSERDQTTKQWHMTMALSLGNIFYQVCISNTTVEHGYTQGLYQQHFCGYNTTQLIEEQFIPYLEQEIEDIGKTEEGSGSEKPEKLAYIQALANTGDQRIIPVLMKLLARERSPQVASKAIYAFYRVVAQYPERVRKIVLPIFHDVSRPTEVRLAAVTMLLATNPPIEYWQKVATSTWYEPSDTMVAVIHSTYNTLANITMAQVQPLFEMSRRARITLPLIRPPQGGFTFSGSYGFYSGQLLPHYQAAALTQFSIIASKSSIIPKVLYVEFQEYINSILYSNYRCSLNVQGGQRIIDDLMGVGGDYSTTRQSPRDLAGRFQKLGSTIKSVKPETFNASIYTQLLGATDIFLVFDEGSLHALVQKVRKGGNWSKDQMQKIAYLEDTTVTFASEIGMPVIYSKKTPMVASVRGKMNAQWSWTNGQYHLSMENVQPFVAVKKLVTVGTISPFSLRTLGAGVENKIQVSLPISLEVKLDIQTKKLHVKVETVQQPSLVKVAHIQSLPFTTAVKVTSYENLVTSPDTKKIMSPKTNFTVRFGKTFGLDGYLRVISDDPIVNFGTLWTEFQKRGAAGITNFWFTMGSLRSRHYDIAIDTANSNFQRLETTFSYESLEEQEMNQPSYSRQHTSHVMQSPRRMIQEQQWELPEVFQQQRLIVSGKRTYFASAIITQKNGAVAQYRFDLGLTHDSQWSTQHLKFLAKSPSKTVTMETTLQFPHLSDNRQQLLRSDIKMNVSGSISDSSYSQQKPILSMQGYVTRDELATEYARTCPESTRCIQHERAGNPNSADCRLAKDHAAIVNYYEFHFADNGLPQSVKKAAYGVEKFFQHRLWPYMSSEPFVQNPNDRVKITMQVNNFKNGMSMNISTPSENTRFDSVPLSFNVLYEPGLVTMRKSLHKKVVDSLYGVDKTVCIVDKRVVKTFDNVTLERQPSDCWTLLAKDSSGIRNLEIYEKVQNQQSVASISVDGTEILIDSANLGTVQINGQSRSLGYNTPVTVRDDSSDKVLAEVLMLSQSQDTVKVVLPEHYAKLLVTKEGVQIYASLMAYRGRMRGVCGDYDGERQDDFVGPDNCIYKDGQQFYEAYRSQTMNPQRCRPSGRPECVPQQSQSKQSQGYYQTLRRY